ncbi:PREDICTED: acyl-CoA synthetase family member 3, mitochondrial [Nicrophorus vespilloides]|uniref:Acyl-CoA synthetase family member 3, mitochondrial n=1 Tax=Nicrophorus vespilloides TaxID=110193 RepID=A0ABM1MBP0_NICVS|nr:PREDICTED: acyl-CoA synthetase family member 3, mitochondrial [Nicrophorus vespilloides]XP_017771989.1 PREDICTED: acyl-CoA synthetase family member 3, mitochondrial [Nicrophorus vespilloides]XP_017771990.1 PREDICTED: acyl-CoA synthetase family member 3, mitochondrial [Nicrophorus vespilloides]
MSGLLFGVTGKQVNRSTYTVVKRLQQTASHPLIKTSQQDVVPVFRRASNYTDKIALKDTYGRYTYGNLFMGAKELSSDISVNVGRKNSERVLFLCPNDASYVLTQWAIWMSGQIAVPLSSLHPQNLLEYYCNDSNAKLLVTIPEYAELMNRVAKNCNKQLLVLDDKLRQNATQKVPSRQCDMDAGLSKDFYNRSNSMILYTSGTTGNPKGVVLTHKNIVTQITTLLDAWRWTENDTILHCLPLHHVHGIVNALMCPLYAGAKINMLPKFDKDNVWSHLLGVNETASNRITTFMAVPTIYTKLIEEHKKLFSQDSKMCEHIKQILKTKVRLMVSGSAPLPIPVYEKWLEISGHKLLERFGMTEIGMCLSNTYEGNREPGYVGLPLPGVSVRLALKQESSDNDYENLIEVTNCNGQINIKKNKLIEGNPVGELHVKGESVFKEYFNRPQATQKEFTEDGWFKTGDLAKFNMDKELFKMLGRTSVDIIKCGGYKVSALEIETHLLGHPKVADTAVVGLKDETWGEIICAIVVLKPEATMDQEEMREWAKTKMPEYTVPKQLKIVQQIDKNAMGKINKKELIKKLFPEN